MLHAKISAMLHANVNFDNTRKKTDSKIAYIFFTRSGSSPCWNAYSSSVSTPSSSEKPLNSSLESLLNNSSKTSGKARLFWECAIVISRALSEQQGKALRKLSETANVTKTKTHQNSRSTFGGSQV